MLHPLSKSHVHLRFYTLLLSELKSAEIVDLMNACRTDA
jgi:hypothetical protein